ncbi:MAG TPA: ATP-binding cassette domain-containing protein [archaeon]|nr:ATP-binding cassette domain-containing protein [archaeon]
MNAIEIMDLEKKFGDFTAVDRISLEIKEGELFGLLGPNGAGKTTTISMLSTILQPTSGTAKVWEHDIVHEKDAVRHSIGIVFQDPSLDDELTGRENLDFHGRMYGMGAEQRKERIAEVLKLVELESRADSLVKTYSGGMKRRLEIARGLMHKPKILFLDEPTIGLDPQTRRRLWEYIKAFNEKEKITIILTTHYMEEADFLCERIAIIDHGKIMALDTPEKLKQVLGGDVITMSVAKPKEFQKILEKTPCVKEAKIFDESLNISVENGSTCVPKLIAIAQKNRIEVNSVILKRPSLEDVFIHYTGRTIREQEADGKDVNKMMMKMHTGGR